MEKSIEISYPCAKCDFFATSSNVLKSHHSLSHQVTVYLCDLCDQDATSWADLKQHRETKHNYQNETQVKRPKKKKWFKCVLCEHIAISPASLKIHVKRTHKNDWFPCRHCKSVERTEAGLTVHMKTVHNKLGLTCPHAPCKYQVSAPGRLRKHIRIVHQGIRFQCHQCRYVGDKAVNLRAHVIDVHEAASCDQCFYVAKSGNILAKHKRRKHSKKGKPRQNIKMKVEPQVYKPDPGNINIKLEPWVSAPAVLPLVAIKAEFGNNNEYRQPCVKIEPNN